jgi:hypothetical protein
VVQAVYCTRATPPWYLHILRLVAPDILCFTQYVTGSRLPLALMTGARVQAVINSSLLLPPYSTVSSTVQAVAYSAVHAVHGFQDILWANWTVSGTGKRLPVALLMRQGFTWQAVTTDSNMLSGNWTVSDTCVGAGVCVGCVGGVVTVGTGQPILGTGSPKAAGHVWHQHKRTCMAPAQA